MSVSKTPPIKNVTEFLSMELDYSSLKNYLKQVSGTISKQGDQIAVLQQEMIPLILRKNVILLRRSHVGFRFVPEDE